MHDWWHSLHFLGALGGLLLSPLALLALSLHDCCAHCMARMRKYAVVIFAVSNACAAFDFITTVELIGDEAMMKLRLSCSDV